MAINAVLQIAASQGQLQDVPLRRLLVRAGGNIACALLVYEAGLFTRTLGRELINAQAEADGCHL